MSEEKILTLHPEPGKSGVNISRRKYDAIRQAIVDTIQEQGEVTFKGLTQDVRAKLEDAFEGSVSWYVTTVKLDLEARGVIERVPKSQPQRLRLVKHP